MRETPGSPHLQVELLRPFPQSTPDPPQKRNTLTRTRSTRETAGSPHLQVELLLHLREGQLWRLIEQQQRRGLQTHKTTTRGRNRQGATRGRGERVTEVREGKAKRSRSVNCDSPSTTRHCVVPCQHGCSAEHCQPPAPPPQHPPPSTTPSTTPSHLQCAEHQLDALGVKVALEHRSALRVDPRQLAVL